MERAILIGSRVSHAMTFRQEGGLPSGDPMAGMIAVKAIQQYVETARRQHVRMVESRVIAAHAQARFEAGDPRAFDDLWTANAWYDAELHFYAIAWALVGRMIKRMKKRSGLKAFGTAHKTWGALFEHYEDLSRQARHQTAPDHRSPGYSAGGAPDRGQPP